MYTDGERIGAHVGGDPASPVLDKINILIFINIKRWFQYLASKYYFIKIICWFLFTEKGTSLKMRT